MLSTLGSRHCSNCLMDFIIKKGGTGDGGGGGLNGHPLRYHGVHLWLRYRGCL